MQRCVGNAVTVVAMNSSGETKSTAVTSSCTPIGDSQPTRTGNDLNEATTPTLEKETLVDQFLEGPLKKLATEAANGDRDAVKLLFIVASEASRALNQSQLSTLQEFAPAQVFWPTSWVADSPISMNTIKEFTELIGLGTKAQNSFARLVKKPTHAKDVAMCLFDAVASLRNAFVGIGFAMHLINSAKNAGTPPRQAIDDETKCSTHRNAQTATGHLHELSRLLGLAQPINLNDVWDMAVPCLSLTAPPLSSETFESWFEQMVALLALATDDRYDSERFGLRGLGDSRNEIRGGDDDDPTYFQEGIRENLRAASKRLLLP